MSVEPWQQCVDLLYDELPSQQFNTWIRPLQVKAEGDELHVYTPNRFVLDWANEKYLGRFLELLSERGEGQLSALSLLIGSKRSRTPRAAIVPSQAHVAPPPPVAPPSTLVQLVSVVLVVVPCGELPPVTTTPSVSSDLCEPEEPDVDPLAAAMLAGVASAVRTKHSVQVEDTLKHTSYLNRTFTFENFIEGKSNQLARAAAWQVADNLKHGYNPLLLYGDVGLGKTHLIHVVGSHLLKKSPNAKVVYLYSERFVADMVKALQLNAVSELKRFYRSVDAPLIDGIQFFACRERSQEEFFHTFNTPLGGGQQVILINDCYPKEIEGLEGRLKSRFGWGLTVAVEPPEPETWVTILMKKVEQAKVKLPHDAAFFIAQRVRPNMRELEGALKRAIAYSHFMDRPITIELIRESLKDLLALQDKLVSIDNIQRTVTEYYGIKTSDPLSKRYSRSVARPRQVTMTLSKELTNHSLPRIGVVFGGQDHATVLHACRKIVQLGRSDVDIREDYKNLLCTLTI